MGSIEFLGTGTSTGVPLIGCKCRVCKSEDPKNNRLRTSALITKKGQKILIDTGPEFRIQAIRHGICDLNGVLITHYHADHVAGFDDLRAFNFTQGGFVKVWGNETTVKVLKNNYPYIFGKAIQEGGGLPQIDLRVAPDSFHIGEAKVITIPVFHGKVPVNGYRIGDLAYVTDVNKIPSETLKLLKGLDILVLGVLRYRKHSTHFNIDEAIEIVQELRPKRVYFTHIGHDLEHQRVSERLKDISDPGCRIDLAFDGLVLKFTD